jgi:hypothetical protein
LRYSDTEQINRHAHYFEMQDGDVPRYRYLLKSAQKTGTQEIVPYLRNGRPSAPSMAGPDGALFEPDGLP